MDLIDLLSSRISPLGSRKLSITCVWQQLHNQVFQISGVVCFFKSENFWSYSFRPVWTESIICGGTVLQLSIFWGRLPRQLLLGKARKMPLGSPERLVKGCTLQSRPVFLLGICCTDPYAKKPDILQADSSKSLRISGWLGDYGYYSSPNLNQQMNWWLMLDGQPLHPSCTASWRYSRFCRWSVVVRLLLQSVVKGNLFLVLTVSEGWIAW